jgi:hypothetical protein
LDGSISKKGKIMVSQRGKDLLPDVQKDIADLAIVAGMVGVATFVYGRIAASAVIGRNVRG